MMTGLAVPADVLVVVGYSWFLVLVAVGLGGVSRLTHHHVPRMRHPGFRYEKGLDVWRCPEGQYLFRHGPDPWPGAARYRALAHVCNHCPAKRRCTDADEGKEILHSTRSWPASEVARFHLVLSLGLLAMAGAALALTWLRHPRPGEGLVLGPSLLLVAGLFRSDWTRLRRSLPDGDPASPSP